MKSRRAEWIDMDFRMLVALGCEARKSRCREYGRFPLDRGLGDVTSQSGDNKRDISPTLLYFMLHLRTVLPSDDSAIVKKYTVIIAASNFLDTLKLFFNGASIAILIATGVWALHIVGVFELPDAAIYDLLVRYSF